MVLISTPGRLKVHVDMKLDNNNVQSQTIYIMVNSRTSRTCVMKFKDFQAPVRFSSTFKALNLEAKNSSTFKDAWEPCYRKTTVTIMDCDSQATSGMTDRGIPLSLIHISEPTRPY